MSSAEEVEKLQSQYSQLIDELRSTPIKQLTEGSRSVISAPRETTLPALLSILLDNNILSAPIWDNEENRYIGFVDVIDILSIIITFTEFKQFAEMFSSKTVEWKDWISQETDVFANGTAYDATGDFTRRNPWKEAKESDKLTSLFELMGDRSVHRIAVFNDEHTKLESILSQSKIIAFIANLILTRFHSIAAVKISEILAYMKSKHPDRQLISIPDSSTVVEAYRKILEEGISGLPIIDNNNRIRYALSVSDIKASLSTEIFNDILMPLPDYMDKIYQFYGRQGKPISCVAEDNLGGLLQMLLITKFHRIFVVDENEVPYSVITLSDLLSYFNSVTKQQ